MQVLTKPVNFVTVADLNEFVNKIYSPPRDFDIIEDLGLNNEESQWDLANNQIVINADKESLSQTEENDLNEFVETGEYNVIAFSLFNDLVNRELIGEGIYILTP